MPTTITANQLSKSFRDYEQYITSGVMFVVPTALAAAVLTPWASIPIAVGSAVGGISRATMKRWGKRGEDFRKENNMASLIIGTVVGVTALLVSFSEKILDSADMKVAAPVYQKLNSMCWTPGQQFNVTAEGKNYQVTLPDYPIPNTVDAIGTLPDGDKLTIQSHGTQATVTFLYSGFWMGMPGGMKKSIEAAKRPGMWNPKTDIISTPQGSQTLTCG